jgi:diguanylate cyclase (GGDEF)-like protein
VIKPGSLGADVFVNGEEHAERNGIMSLRSRGVTTASLLLALCLLPAGIGAAMGQRSQAAAALDAGLAHSAAEQAEVLSDYFARARSLTLLAAHNPAFADFYAARGARMDKIRSDRELMGRIDDGLGYLETLFPGSIGEACFIDRSGAENARTVRGHSAALSDLSTDESRNPFFAPTFALPIGAVYQARPYVSPDTKEWVISNSTPLETSDRSKPAILHFEVTVESFRAAAARTSQYGVDVVDAETGRVVFDSGFQQRPGAPLGQPADSRFTSLAHTTSVSGRITLAGRPAVYRHVASQAGNANDWIVVAVAPAATDWFYGIGPMSVGLVVVALLLLVVAAVFDLLARRELVSAATTDALTGLGNRRKLLEDLRVQLRSASTERPLVLLLFDLNGFKSYNDTFGHSAGDELLARLGRALRAAVGDGGTAYRLGGDEFCVLAQAGGDGGESATTAAAAALTEQGSGFRIDASYGAIVLPSESRDVAEALRLVDQRMYAQKRSSRRPADRQSQDVLLHALYERDPDVVARSRQVGALAGEVARRMGLSADEVQQITQAGELGDIGQVAIPDSILAKPACALDDEEKAFLNTKPVISERIIGAAPALAQVARLVRSIGEHVSGAGHPDGLSGEAIPLGSRIVAACQRYVLLVDGQDVGPAGRTAALAVLQAEAGTCLDPEIVRVLRRVLADPRDVPAAAVPSTA